MQSIDSKQTDVSPEPNSPQQAHGLSVDEDFLDSLPSKTRHSPTVLVVSGLAGTGKSTLTGALARHLKKGLKKRVYIINLDPAVSYLPYTPKLDIRDTVKYKKIMSKYNLGPNGAILTALNLYTTKFNKVMRLLERRRDELDYIIIDTPGQIEVFNWSASGLMILQSLSLSFPTVMLYSIDSQKCNDPVVLISNLLFTTCLAYRSSLPVINILTKSDLANCDKLKKLIKDPMLYINEAEAYPSDSYAISLAKTLALQLGEFYNEYDYLSCKVDVDTGSLDITDTFEESIKLLVDEYYEKYLPNLVIQHKRIMQQKQEQALAEFNKFQEDNDESD